MERGWECMLYRECESVRRVLAGIARRSFRDCMIGVLQRYRWEAHMTDGGRRYFPFR